MRFCVPIVLKNKSDPAKAVVLESNYNGYFLSLIKLGLASTNPALYAHLYKQKNVKDFATSVYFPSALFDYTKIHLNRDGKVLLNFTTNDRSLGFNFFNAFMFLHQQSLKANKKQVPPLAFNKDLVADVWKLSMVNTSAIVTDSAKFRTLSPILLKNKDKKYLVCANETDIASYNDALRSYLHLKLAGNSHLQKLSEQLVFEPIFTKKVVRRMYGVPLDTTTGVFRLKGDPELLTYLQDSGIGSSTGSFCGMIEKID